MIEFTDEELLILAEAYIENKEFTLFLHRNHYPELRKKNAFNFASEIRGDWVTIGWFLNTEEHSQLKELEHTLIKMESL